MENKNQENHNHIPNKITTEKSNSFWIDWKANRHKISNSGLDSKHMRNQIDTIDKERHIEY
jgi:hypothetical protein